jgi:hypothetical protein
MAQLSRTGLLLSAGIQLSMELGKVKKKKVKPSL